MLRFPVPLRVIAALLLVVSSADVAAAQESRTAIIAAAQAEKARTLAPYVPNRAERALVTLQREMLQDPSGFYPLFASVYSGGGFTLGGGYRRFYGDRTHADVKGLYSLQNYKLFEVSSDSWGHADGRVNLHVRAGWRDATAIAFSGLGMDTPEDAANFRMQQAYAGGELTTRPARWVRAGAGVSYEDFSLESGAGDTPSIETVFTTATAPGLGVNPAYLHTTASAGIDTRTSPGYARRGGLLALTYHNYADRQDAFSFDRLDAEVVQHVPILRETWVLSLHGLVQTTLDDADSVPYFLLPALGGGSSLRGYSGWRFRDRTSLLMSGEFRWIPNRMALDMAIFYDVGKVTPRFHDLSFSGLASDVGFGIRFHGPLATPLRLDIAKSREGVQLVFGGSAAF
jgi:hypothetical protein